MKKLTMLFLIIIFISAGCGTVTTINPICTSQSRVTDPNIIGSWVTDTNSITTFIISEYNKPDFDYAAKFYDDRGRKHQNLAFNLSRIDDQLYIDIEPTALPGEPNDQEIVVQGWLFMPLHTFAKIDINPNRIKCAFTKTDKFKEYVEQNPSTVNYIEKQNRIILTGPTPQLRKFISRNQDKAWLMPREITLTRKAEQATKSQQKLHQTKSQ